MENHRKGQEYWNMLQVELELSALVCAPKLIQPLSPPSLSIFLELLPIFLGD